MTTEAFAWDEPVVTYIDGDERSDPTITGLATSMAIDGEFMLQPVRLI